MVIDAKLRAELLDKLTAYLEGRESGEDVSARALRFYVDDRKIEDNLCKWTVNGLVTLGHEDPQWDTPVEDLEFYRDCLLGKQEFTPVPVVMTRS